MSLLAVLVMPFLPESLVKTVLGAKRWIRLGPVSLAPVEFFKVGFVFFIAWSFSRKLIHRGRLSLKREILVLLPYLGVFALAVVLIAIFQKDLGQVVVLAATLMVLFIMAGRSMKLFFLFFMLGIAGFIGLILVAPHRLQRIRSWWSTVQDNFLSFFPSDIVEKLRIPETSEPYQISNSLNAVYNGGWFGQGLGNGQFKLGYLSEVHTDFILAGLSEELGYVSLFLVSCLVVFIIFRLLRIASRLGQPAYYIYSVGVALLILFAFVVNSYGISGITPIKGIAVPFLSYGGSQIIAGSIGVGMVLMISKKA
jgi:cell division protein FtsW